MPKKGLTPPQLLALGFLGMILGGGLLLHLPFATESGEPLPLLDALFTATSATTVTGLTVTDTGTTFSLFGELLILLLIQVGGLGVMTVSTLVSLAIGRRIFLRERLFIQEALGSTSTAGVVRLVRAILILTAVFEGIGALLLGLRFSLDYGWQRGLYLGLFQSISAFCNAGFSLFPTNLVPYQEDLLVNLVITGLIISGGLGFFVLTELLQHRRGQHLSLHTKLVCTATLFLIVLGTALFLLLESRNPETLAPLSPGKKLLAVYFQAVTPRTAGLNTLPIEALFPSTLFFLLILMFIGASPGGTGGGIKTTTFGTLVAVVYALLTKKQDIEVFHRRLPHGTILKSLVIITLSLSLVLTATTILLATEAFPPLQVLFEVTSAFGTVGLSTGITPYLSPLAKIVIMVVMYTGRLGPLTIAFALAPRVYAPPSRHYPEERIMVG